jgi:hypothetical protein
MGKALYKNNVSTTLASAVTSSIQTSIVVATGMGASFPTLSGSDFFYCTLANTSGIVEIVKVTAVSTDTFTVARGQDNTIARSSWAIGDKVELRIVAIECINWESKCAATSGTSILKGDGVGNTANATASTDYAPATSGSAILKGNGAGGFSAASAGTDYVAPGAITGTGITALSGNLLGRTTAGTGAVEEISVGAGLSLSAGALTSTVSGGVTAVGASSPLSSTGGATPNISHLGTGGVAAGTYPTSAQQSGGYFLSSITLNATGHVTAVTIGIPAGGS